MNQNWLAPWMSLWGAQNNVELPSGDVSQLFKLFSPTVEVNGKGDPELESRIVREVATYGAQIGQLSEIVLALAEGKPAPEEAVTKLRKIADEIATVKESYRENVLVRAREALDDLHEHDPRGYELLLASLTAREKKQA